MPPTDRKYLPLAIMAESVQALHLPAGVKVKLNTKAGLDTLCPMRFFDQDCACFGTNQGNSMQDMPFFNRIAEKELLVEPRNYFVMLNGPAGYGKSYLLQELKRIYKTDQRFLNKWDVISICLGSSQSDIQGEWITENMAHQLGLELKVDSDSKDFALLEIANHTKRKGKALLVLLDGLELSSEGELIWLRYRLPYQLRSVLGTDIRVILSGRHISRRVENLSNINGRVRQQERLLPFLSCFLTSFDNGVVSGAISWYEEKWGLPKPSNDLYESIDHWIEEICFLSGGHPEAIISLVEDLVKTKWGWILQDKRYIPELSRQELFRRCLKSVSESVFRRTIGDIKGPMLSGPGYLPVTKEVLEDLEVLAFLRRFDMGVLVRLKQLELLSTEPSLLQGFLVSKGLSSGIDAKTGWQKNDGIPRLIALQKRYQARTRKGSLEAHRKLHEVFRYLAVGWDVKGQIVPQGDVWRNAINILLSSFESLYHFLNGIEIEKEPLDDNETKALETQLKHLMVECLVALRPYCSDDSNTLQRFRGMLNDQDQYDIRFLGCWLLGNDIWTRACDELMNSLVYSECADQSSETVVLSVAPNLTTEGDHLMNKRNLLDCLVDSLDLLRHNARNVLIERWERRNLNRAITPPAFDEKARSRDELLSLLPKEGDILAKLRTYQKLDGTAMLVTVEHIQNLRKQTETAQQTVDRWNLALEKALATTDRVVTEQQRDEAQGRFNRAVEELADILAFLYTQ